MAIATPYNGPQHAMKWSYQNPAIHYLFTYLLFIVLCTMHYALFIRIHTYSLFHMTKSRDFDTYAKLSSRRVNLTIGPKSHD